MALTIVHMETQIGAVTSDLYYELYDEEAPNTVANFLGYINRGDFDNSFFHRKAQYSDGSPFIVQGGGFTYEPVFDFDAHFFKQFGIGLCDNLVEAFDPLTGELGLRPVNEPYVLDFDGDDCAERDINGDIIVRINDGLGIVPVDGSFLPLLSESGRSNQRGTIAMALFPDSSTGQIDPDSALSQWYINLVGNTQLDPTPTNRGFTVFGSILNNGIDFFDQVDTLVTNVFADNVHPEFGNIPLFDYEPLTLMLQENLVRLNTASEVLSVDITDHDFGYVPVGNNDSVIITLTAGDQWTPGINVDMVGDLELLAAPLNAIDDCSALLMPGDSCQITISFTPTVEGNYEDVLDISFNGLNIPNILINVKATSRSLPTINSSVGNAYDFVYVYPGIPESHTITIQNPGQNPLIFNDIVLTGSDVANFSFSHDCTTLGFEETCEIEVTLTSPDEGVKTATLTIDSNDSAGQFFDISLTGEGSTVFFPTVDVVSEVDFGDLPSGGFATETILITNSGNDDLRISQFIMTGDNASEFDSTICPPIIVPAETCSIAVTFDPVTIGEKQATLEISSNVPTSPVTVIELTGTSSSDSDNVSDKEEDMAPNNGDGNADGISDKLQGNVISMSGISGTLVTMVTSDSLAFTGADIVANPSPLDAPPGVADKGVISYTLQGIPVGVSGSFAVGMMLTTSEDVDTFYHFGPTAENPVPHWYEFMFDGETGAEVLNSVTLTLQNGTEINSTFVRIWYADGKRGDDDLTVDGSIISNSSFSLKPRVINDTKGSLNVYLLLLFGVTLLIRSFGRAVIR